MSHFYQSPVYIFTPRFYFLHIIHLFSNGCYFERLLPIKSVFFLVIIECAHSLKITLPSRIVGKLKLEFICFLFAPNPHLNGTGVNPTFYI